MSLPSLLIDPDLREFNLEVARERVQDWQRFNQSGINADIDVAAAEDISNNGDVTMASTAESLEIISASASDDGDPVGTGANTVVIYGLDSTYNLISETVTLNGTSAVALVNTYIRTYLVRVDISGSGATNAGILTLRVASAGATRIIVPAAEGQSQQVNFTIPSGYDGYLLGYSVRLLKTIPASVVAQARLFIREQVDILGSWVIRHYTPQLEAGKSEYVKRWLRPIKLKSATDIKLVGDTSVDNTGFAAELDILIVSQAAPPPGTEIASFTDETFAQGERVLVAGQTNKRPFVSAGSLLDKDGLSTDLALWVGVDRILLETSAAGTKTKLEHDWFGRPGESIIITAQGTGSGKYWITCGLIDDVVLGDRLRGE